MRNPEQLLREAWEQTLDSPSHPVPQGNQDAGEAALAAFYDTPETAVEAALSLREALLALRHLAEPRLAVRRTPSDENEKHALRMTASLAQRAAPGELIVDRSTAAEIGPRLVAKRRLHREPSVLDFAPASRDSPWRDKVEIAGHLVTATVGLAAWVAVLGGITMWARLNGAHVPVHQGITALPREVLITEGLLTLLLPLLLGGGAVLVVSATTRRTKARAFDTLGRFFSSGRWFVLVPTALLLFYLHWGVDLNWWAVSVMLVLAIVAICFLLLFLASPRSRTAYTVAAFAIIVLWTGVLGYARERWNTGARLEPATVLRSGDIPVNGLFVTRTSDAVFVAVDSQNGQKTADCDLLVIPSKEIRELRIGHRGHRPNCARKPRQQVAQGRTVTVIETVTKPEFVTVPSIVTVPKVVTVREPITVQESTTVTVNQAVPAGAKDLGDRISIPVASVNLPARLIVASVHFSPDPLRVRRAIEVKVEVRDTRNYVVRGALVNIRDVPGLEFDVSPKKATTKEDGTATLQLTPRKTLKFGKHRGVAVFVRAQKPGEPVPGGVSARLVQFHVR